jgi:hypothetical protein
MILELEPSMPEEITTSRYGVAVRLVDAAGGELSQRLRDTLPPEFTGVDGAASVAVSYVVTVGPQADAAEHPGYAVTRDGSPVCAAATEDDVFTWLCQDIDNTVAQRSRRMLFVHAGVIGWRGFAIVIPGRSHSGKSTLVAELVGRGAVYYSDEFAVLDDAGMVHPYRRPLVLRGETRPSVDLRLLRADAPPLPIGVVVAGPYQPGVTWRPTVASGAKAVLPLIDGTVQGREESAKMLRIAAGVAPGVVTLQGLRSEAAGVAAEVLDLVDDALVSRALRGGETDSRPLAADLIRVAELRLLSRARRPAPTDRRLQATRYVRMTHFLAPAEHRRLLDHVLAHQDEFQESGIIGPQGELGVLDYAARKSRTLSNRRLEEVWEMFERRLARILSAVRRELGIPWFSVGKVERQLTVHGSGGFFVPHVDTGSAVVATRRISGVYYFHETPRRFTGGELKLYDTWVTPSGTTGATTHATLAPADNSIVFFPSDAFHEVCPVHPESDAFGDSRFTVTIWFHEGQRPARLDGVEAR